MGPEPIDTTTARRVARGGTSHAHPLLDRQDLSVVQEVLPPGAASEPHAHRRSRQFFYVLSGEVTVVLGRRDLRLAAGSGLEVPARTGHQIRNDGEAEAQLLVISSPRAGGEGRVRTGSTRRPGGADAGRLLVGTHLRATRHGDLARIVAFEDALDTRHFLGEGGLEWHERALRDPDIEHWVLVDRLDHVIAFGVLAGLSRPGMVELRRMVVDPAGRGQGVGRSLLRHLLEQALAASGGHRVWLDVSADNTRARSLYRAMGFVEKEPPEWAVLLDDGIYLEWAGARHNLGR